MLLTGDPAGAQAAEAKYSGPKDEDGEAVLRSVVVPMRVVRKSWECAYKRRTYLSPVNSQNEKKKKKKASLCRK